MSMTLTEDDIYRTSTQFRLWSFAPEGLAALRLKTHQLAIERARRYTSSDVKAQDNGADSVTAQCLTVEEELRLVQRYCDQIRTTTEHFHWPVNVKATAVQYLRRFYLSNSVHTYPPKEIYKTVLYLAIKSEGMHMTVADYARRISTDADAILAPEYKVMQALRFTLDVRQPYKGLKGVLMELTNVASGVVGEVEGVETKGAKQLQQDLLALELPGSDARTPWKPPQSGKVKPADLKDRIDAAYHAARELVSGPGLLTDVYFLYTPSQLLLAAMHIADEPLTSFYLSTKLPISSDVRPKVLVTVHACADLLASFSETDVISKSERERLEEKLESCRDPATKDLVKAHAAAKQGGEDDEGKAQRRKLAREKSAREGEDLFGPGLGGKG